MMYNCKWCGKRTPHSDRQCSKCWMFINHLKHALYTPELFKMLKQKVEERSEEIDLKENIEASIIDLQLGNVMTLEEAEKESFKETEN